MESKAILEESASDVVFWLSEESYILVHYKEQDIFYNCNEKEDI